MDYKDWSSKLENVLERVDKDTLYDFITAYARTHEDFALLLVNEFWQAEKDDYRSMVQQCLMHPSPAGTKNGDGYDWGAIAADLSQMMNLAEQKVKEGCLLDAAEIARYVMTLTCAEYEADHPYGESYGEVWWLRRKPLKEVLERARVMLTELLITGDDIDDDSQRGLVKEIVAECKSLKKSHICRMDELLEDAQAKMLSELMDISDDDVEAQIYMERKMYDHLVKFCLHTSYNAEENMERYAKYMSEADQRLVAQDIVERMKRRAPECKRGSDYDHFAGWIGRLYNSSPECQKIARETAEEIVKENPNKAFRRMFERIGVM